MEELLSIILPVYNGERYLRECLNSVINQTYKNLEIIVIDDGSLDSTPLILTEFANLDERIKILKQENLGGQNARNVGLSSVSGKYVAFVDADDVLALNAYEILINILEKENAEISACSFTREQSCLATGDNLNTAYTVINKSDMPIKSIMDESLIANCGGYLWNKVYLASILKGVRFNKNINVGEDGLFNLKLANGLTKICISNLPLYFYRQNESSVSNVSKRSFSVLEKELNEFVEELKNSPNEYLTRFIKRNIVNRGIACVESAIREKLGKQKIKEIKAILKKYGDIKVFRSMAFRVKYWIFYNFTGIYALTIK